MPKKDAKKRAKAGSALLDTLNTLRARELAVIEQYMRHHYIVTGPEGAALADEFKEVAITEMKHAEALAERIDFLGGDPTTTPSEISKTATALDEMAAEDLLAEQDAVALYSAAVKQFADAGDVTTRRLLEGILGDEEDHVNTFERMLGK